MSQIDSVIFDLDGTLWDAVDNILISWNNALADYNSGVSAEMRLKPITKPKLTECMGLKMDDIAARLFPTLSKEKQLALMDKCSAFELDYLRKNGARLFEGVTDTIKALYGLNLKLFICSNCQKGYIECFLDYFRLREYFKDIECWGNTGLTKGENIRLLVSRHSLLSPIYVGDTMGDKLSADYANIPFVFASYGFGSCEETKHIITAPTELITLVKNGDFA